MELSPVRRTPDGAVVAGVCAGLARRWQLDPTVLRVAIVVLSLFAGLGVAGYVGAVLLVPKEGSSDFPIRTLLPFTKNWSAAAVIGSVVGLGLLIIATIGGMSPLGLGPAIGLGFLWYFGFYRHRSDQSTSSAGPSIEPGRVTQPPTTDFERAAAAWQARVAEHRAETIALAPPVQPANNQLPPLQFFGAPTPSTPPPALVPVSAPPPTNSPRTGAPWLWPATLICIGLALTALVVLGAGSPTAYWAAALGCVGTALVVSAFVGRPRWLLLSGLGLALATVISLAPAPTATDYSLGDQTWTFTSQADLPSSRMMGAGDLVIDLSSMPNVTSDTDTTFGLQLGDLTLKLPESANYTVDWDVKAGSIALPGGMSVNGARDGLNVVGSLDHVIDPNKPTLHIHLQVQLGDVVLKP